MNRMNEFEMTDRFIQTMIFVFVVVGGFLWAYGVLKQNMVTHVAGDISFAAGIMFFFVYKDLVRLKTSLKVIVVGDKDKKVKK